MTHSIPTTRSTSRRSFLGASIAAAGSAALASCSSKSSSGSTSSKKTLVYFNARAAEPVERALIQQYEKDHPDVSIKYLATTALNGPSDTDAIANLVFSIQAHTVIDVAKVEVSRTPLDLVSANAIKPLNGIGDDTKLKSTLDDLQNASYVNFVNGTWALPYEFDPFGYIYNGSMYSEAGLDPANPPRTWDDLRAANRTLKKKFPDAWVITHPLKNQAKATPYVWSAGGRYWNKPILPTKADMENEGIKEAYAFFQEWAKNGWLNNQEITSNDDVQWFLSRKCVAMDLSASLVLQLQLNDPKTDWRVAPIVSKTASDKQINFGGGSALIIPSTTKYPEEALKFIEWLASPEGQSLKYGLTKGLGASQQDILNQATPASKSVSEKLKQQKEWGQALATTDIPTRAPGVSPAYSDSYNVLAEMQERILLKMTNVDTELAKAQKECQALLDKAIEKNAKLYPKG